MPPLSQKVLSVSRGALESSARVGGTVGMEEAEVSIPAEFSVAVSSSHSWTKFRMP